MVSLPRPRRLPPHPLWAAWGPPRLPAPRLGSPWPCHPGAVTPGCATGTRGGRGRRAGSPSPVCHHGDPSSVSPVNRGAASPTALAIPHYPAAISAATNLTTNRAARFLTHQTSHRHHPLGGEPVSPCHRATPRRTHQSQPTAVGTAPRTPGTTPRAASSGCHGSQATLVIPLGKLRHAEQRDADPTANTIPFATGTTSRLFQPKFPTRISRLLPRGEGTGLELEATWGPRKPTSN